MKLATTKYEAQRALDELYRQREAADWAGDTVRLPKLNFDFSDTMPMLPALLRPQAD